MDMLCCSININVKYGLIALRSIPHLVSVLFGNLTKFFLKNFFHYSLVLLMKGKPMSLRWITTIIHLLVLDTSRLLLLQWKKYGSHQQLGLTWQRIMLVQIIMYTKISHLLQHKFLIPNHILNCTPSCTTCSCVNMAEMDVEDDTRNKESLFH